MSDFYITLRSDASSQEFINNTTANFTTNLATELRLIGDDYKIGLVSISYPNTLRNIRKNHNQMIVKGLDFHDRKKEIVFKIPEGYYNSIQEVMKILNSQIRTKLNEEVPSDPERSSSAMNHHDAFTLNERNMKVYVNKRTLQDFNDIFKSITRIYFNGNLATIFGFEMEKHDLQSDLVGEHMANLNFGISPDVFLYLNIIYPQLVGDCSCEVIKIFPTLKPDSRFSEIILREFPTPQYVKILTKNIRNINVQLKNNLNEFMDFIFGVVTVVLHVKSCKADVRNGE